VTLHAILIPAMNGRSCLPMSCSHVFHMGPSFAAAALLRWRWRPRRSGLPWQSAAPRRLPSRSLTWPRSSVARSWQPLTRAARCGHPWGPNSNQTCPILHANYQLYPTGSVQTSAPQHVLRHRKFIMLILGECSCHLLPGTSRTHLKHVATAVSSTTFCQLLCRNLVGGRSL
jgi:hypothetical protein